MVPPQLIGAGIGGIGGILKNLLIDRPNAQEQQRMEIAKMRYGYPLGIQGQYVHVPSVGESIFTGGLQGVMGGAGIGQSIGQMGQDQGIYDAYKTNLDLRNQALKNSLPSPSTAAASSTMDMIDTNMATPAQQMNGQPQPSNNSAQANSPYPAVVPGRVAELSPDQVSQMKLQNFLQSPYAKMLVQS